MRRLLLVLGLVLVIGLFAWRVTDALRSRSARTATSQRPQGVIVQVAKVQRATLEVRTTYLGEVTPRVSIDVFARISGIVTDVLVTEGDVVRRGQVLVRLDPKDLRFQVEQARATVEAQRLQVEASAAALRTQRARLEQTLAGPPQEQIRQAEEQVRQARANLEYSKAQLTRIEGLFNQGYLSRQQVDAARLDVAVQEGRVRSAEEQLALLQREPRPESVQIARAQVEEAETASRQAVARLSQAGVSLRQAESLLAESTVLAPVAGLVSRRSADPGETATPSAALLQLVDIDPAVITVAVPERELAQIRPGMSVTIYTDALSGQAFHGQVASISPILASATRTADVRVEIPNLDHRLRPGMLARVEMLLARREAVLTVPIDAVLEKDGERTVFVVEQNTARARRVEVGVSDGVLAEIAAGLKEGESVVVVGNRNLRDGMPVLTGQGGSGANRAPGGPPRPQPGGERRP